MKVMLLIYMEPTAKTGAEHRYEDFTRLASDLSVEAIPERDPNYRLPPGTDHGGPTIAEPSADLRQALARRLERLGMSAARAAHVSLL